MYKKINNTALSSSVSNSRLKKYLAETEGNIDKAIALYEKNISVSESLYTALQGVEICLRNTINRQMCLAYDDNWLINKNENLDEHSKYQIDKVFNPKGSLTNDDIVAKASFAFWVGLLSDKSDEGLWRKSLYKCFMVKNGKTRSEVHKRMNAIRRFRNRVAHHEPILDKVGKMHAEIIEAVGWMCEDTSIWLQSISKFKL